MADELHAEFLLRLCEIGEDKVNEASEYIDWFCLDVINKIWGKRTRVKSYETGSTSPFFEFSTSHISEQQVFITPDYDVTFDFKAKEAKDILNKDIEDHIPEMIRYAVMTRPMIPKHKEKTDRRSFQSERRKLIAAKQLAARHGISLSEAYNRS
jgi:hypothetical protein